MATAQDGSCDACADHLVGNFKIVTYDKSHKNTVSKQQQQQQEISSYWHLQQVFTRNSGKFVHDIRFDLKTVIFKAKTINVKSFTVYQCLHSKTRSRQYVYQEI